MSPRTTDEIVRRVLAWYPGARRDLPWRSPARTPWGVLVSEVMLQQTPVVRVVPRWLEWMARWPTPAALAAATPAEVLTAWDTLGYPRRALRLRECAEQICARHGGTVPDNLEELRALPGVGDYTAGAVLAFGYGKRSVVLDTNVRRVLARAVSGLALPPPHLGRNERIMAESLVPADPTAAAEWAAGSMELGALVCTVRSPHCEVCPLAELCAWRAAGFPADQHASRRRTQAWHGTDRQVRGRIMALLRRGASPARADVAALLPDVPSVQLTRALAGLVADGLAVCNGAGQYRLPS